MSSFFHRRKLACRSVRRGVRLGLAGCCLLLAADAATAQPFTFQYLRNDLDALHFGSITWADADGDGLLDVLLTGAPEAGPPYTPAARLFLNRREITLLLGEEQVPAPFRLFDRFDLPVRVWHSAAAWSDYDHDGDPDLVVLGAVNAEEPFVAATRLLRNDGGGTFTPAAALRGLHSGSAAWGDFDNDGDEDLLLTGVAADGYATLLYRNDGDGAFAEVDAGLVGVAFGEAEWGDFDNDGDLDILAAGVTDRAFVTRVYRNDGGGVFVDLQADLLGLAFSAVDWGDFDNDGDLDILAAGGVLDTRVLVGALLVYRNDRNDRFSPVLAETGSFLEGEAEWGDFDNDGSLDFLVVGARFPDGPRTARVYANQDNRLHAVLHLAGTLFGDAAWGDFDGDDDLDVALGGLARNANVLANLYENTQRRVNTAPEPPEGLRAVVAGNAVTLSWDAASDDQTAAPGLTYNLRVGAAPGGLDVVSPLADPATGRRLVAAPGNVFHNTSWRLTGLPPGAYFWSVQAVDASFVGSAFAAEGSFSVAATGETSTDTAREDAARRETLLPNFPNPFRERTTIGYALGEAAPVRLAVYDVLGRRVAVLVDGFETPGQKTVAWDGLDERGERLAPGLYVYRLETGTGYTQSRAMTLLR